MDRSKYNSRYNRAEIAGDILLSLLGSSSVLERPARDLVSFSFEVANEFIKKAQEWEDSAGDAY